VVVVMVVMLDLLNTLFRLLGLCTCGLCRLTQYYDTVVCVYKMFHIVVS